MKLSTILYGTKVEIASIGKAVGTAGIAGVGVSTHRSGEVGAPKLSTAATIFDLLGITPASFCAYKSTSTDFYYCEINGIPLASKTIAGAENILLPAEGGLHHRHSLISSIVRYIDKDTEGRAIMEEAIKQYKTTGAFPFNTAFALCDSYYYGYAKSHPELKEDYINIEEVKAAFRSGDMQRVDIFDGYGLAKSVYETGTTEDTTPAYKRGTSKSGTSFIDECKTGKYAIPYVWDSKVLGMIPPLSDLDRYEETPEFVSITKKIYNNLTRIIALIDGGESELDAIKHAGATNILVLGKPGTGKTAMIHAVAAALQLPIGTTVHNKHTDEDEYEGKTRIVDGHPAFVETESLILHEFGGIDVCEEINLADPSVTMGGLGQKLEYPFIIKKNGYATVRRHPMNVVLATMNIGTNGSHPLNQALVNRFRSVFIMDDPTKDTFVMILQKTTGASKAVCEALYAIYDGVQGYLRSPAVNEEEVCQNLSIRTCCGLYENLQEGQSLKQAIMNSIGGAVAAAADLELARKLEKEFVDCMPAGRYKF